MRHDDRSHGKLIIDPEHLLVMNAGRGFWHEERTPSEDERLRMLQIFARLHTLDLEPRLQHGPLAALHPNQWRLLFGLEGQRAPFYVRSDIEMHDVHLDAGASAMLPHRADWHTYF